MFKDGQTLFTVKSEVVSHLQRVRLVQSVDQKICERQRFTISELLCEFPQILCTVLYGTITVLHKMDSENAHGCAQNSENDFSFNFSTVIPQRWQ
jgi:hypothetical protein